MYNCFDGLDCYLVNTMVRSPLAPQGGYDYQALFFWTKALDMLISDNIQSVIFESEDVKVVDDVVVNYKDNYRDEETGQQIDIDFFQLKYHMSQSDAFSSDNLTNPDFVHNKQSLIQRLYSVYKTLIVSNKSFRLYIVSPWHWDSKDILYKYFDANCGRFTREFFKKPNKNVTAYKKSIKDLLKIDDDNELDDFFATLRFEYCTLNHIKRLLTPLLFSNKLKPIDYSISTNQYERLPWKFLKQEITQYSKVSLAKLLEKENLFIKEEKLTEVFFVQSYETVVDKYIKACSQHLDVSTEFKNSDHINWSSVEHKLKEFALKIYNSNKEIHLLLQTRLSISLYFGYILKDQQAGVNVVPTLSDLTPWPDPKKYTSGHWNITVLNKPNNDKPEEIILLCSVTHDIKPSAYDYLKKNQELNNKTIFSLECNNGCSSASINDASHAWSMANELADELSRRCQSNNLKIHLFYAGPSALAYIMGKKLQLKAIELFLYEHNKIIGEYIPAFVVRRGD